jgi:hypothetical protein
VTFPIDDIGELPEATTILKRKREILHLKATKNVKGRLLAEQ